MSRFRSQIFAALLLAVLAVAGCTQKKAVAPSGAASGPPPVPALLGTAEKQVAPVEIVAIGSVEASQSVQVRAQAAGELVKVRFQEGQNVKAGELLFQIDPRPYQQALSQAEAAVARDQALLKQAQATLLRDQAQLRNAESDVRRNEELMKAGIIAKSQFETIRTSADVYAEGVKADQAAIQSAQATLEADRAAAGRTRLELSYCEIHAPVSGHTGNLLVQAGNYIKANGDTGLVVINQIQPVFVNFSVSEDRLAAVRRLSAGRRLPVRAVTKDGGGKEATGWLSVVDNSVDATTGTIRLKASFPNTDSALWPGQFVNVTLALEPMAEAVVVPSEAVQAGQKGAFVYVVKKDMSVEARQVAAGRTIGGKTVIESGIEAGETVVTDGQLLLAPGARVMPLPPAGQKAGAGKQ